MVSSPRKKNTFKKPRAPTTTPHPPASQKKNTFKKPSLIRVKATLIYIFLCGPFTEKIKNEHKNLKAGDSKYIYQNELDKALFLT